MISKLPPSSLTLVPTVLGLSTPALLGESPKPVVHTTPLPLSPQAPFLLP